jgi:predicted aconitase with swiveling domain
MGRMKMLLKGRKVNGGIAEGEAIVSKLPFSYLGDLDPRTGIVLPEGHDLRGQRIAGKIFVFPIGKGSTVGPNVAYSAKRLGNTPKAMVCVHAEPVMAMVAIMNDIPMVADFDDNILDMIRSGDRVRVDGDTGIIEVIGDTTHSG